MPTRQKAWWRNAQVNKKKKIDVGTDSCSVRVYLALEVLSKTKDEAIARLEGQVHQLTERIKEMKHTHKMELQEAHVRIQQEMYLAKHFREPGSSNRRTAGPRYNARGRKKPQTGQ